ncbi:MAG: hypothetical protein WDZ91_14725 [Paenibacillaceae bacterium]
MDYITLKCFRLLKEFLLKFHISSDPYYVTIYSIVKKELKTIVQEAQNYLDEYQKGNILDYATNINGIYLSLQGIVKPQEVALGSDDVQQQIIADINKKSD